MSVTVAHPAVSNKAGSPHGPCLMSTDVDAATFSPWG